MPWDGNSSCGGTANIPCNLEGFCGIPCNTNTEIDFTPSFCQFIPNLSALLVPIWVFDPLVCTGPKLKRERSSLDIRGNFFIIRTVKQWNRSSGEIGQSLYWIFFKIRLDKAVSVLARSQSSPCFKQDVRLQTFRGPFQTDLFYDTIKFDLFYDSIKTQFLFSFAQHSERDWFESTEETFSQALVSWMQKNGTLKNVHHI